MKRDVSSAEIFLCRATVASLKYASYRNFSATSIGEKVEDEKEASSSLGSGFGDYDLSYVVSTNFGEVTECAGASVSYIFG